MEGKKSVGSTELTTDAKLKKRGPRPELSSQSGPLFIDRDYTTNGVAKKFNTSFPQELEGLIKPEDYEVFITRINEMFVEAEAKTWKNEVRRVLSSIPMVKSFIDSPTEQAEKQMAEYVEIVNHYLFKPCGVYVTDPNITDEHIQIDVCESYKEDASF